MSSLTQQPQQRRYDIDWLRVLAILSVFIFHSSRFFDTGGWHVKNSTTYLGVQLWVSFLGQWLMPLIFVISGGSLYYALNKRDVKKFVVDKVLRLLVPLLAGIFTHIILGVYFERVTQHQFVGSFFDFLPFYFQGLYGFGGNFAWMGLHLWYLEVLFIYSLALYPLFRWLKGDAGARLLNAIGNGLAQPGVMFLLATPIVLCMVALDPRTLWGMRDMGGWNLVIYLLFFVYGFALFSHQGVQQRIIAQRGIALVAAIVATGVTAVLWLGNHGDPPFGSTNYTLIFGCLSISSWCWILTILGFGMRYLTTNTPFLRYANEAVLPFYVMHQTVLLCVGFFVVQWPIPDLLKYVIIAPTSLAIIMGLYELLIRRVNILRLVFGMKWQRATPVQHPAQPPVTPRIVPSP